MQLLGYMIINTAALLVTAYVVPGFVVDSFISAVVTAILIGAVNTFIKPVLTIITLPITILTLGLFAFFLNVILLMTIASFTPGFSVDGLLTAVIGSIVLSLVSSFLGHLTR